MSTRRWLECQRGRETYPALCFNSDDRKFTTTRRGAALEVLTESAEVAVADDAGGEAEEGFVDVVVQFEAELRTILSAGEFLPCFRRAFVAGALSHEYIHRTRFFDPACGVP